MDPSTQWLFLHSKASMSNTFSLKVDKSPSKNKNYTIQLYDQCLNENTTHIQQIR
jgi:hypothetical protein